MFTTGLVFALKRFNYDVRLPLLLEVVYRLSCANLEQREGWSDLPPLAGSAYRATGDTCGIASWEEIGFGLEDLNAMLDHLEEKKVLSTRRNAAGIREVFCGPLHYLDAFSGTCFAAP